MLAGKSPEMKRINKLIKEIAKTDGNVMLVGETGTGKKMIARQIHQRSRQKNKPFVIINCTAVGETLTDAELFGEKQESSTGINRKIALLEQAGSGILYLENLDELHPEYQKRFLNIFNEHQLIKPGADQPVKVSYRLMASVTRPEAVTGPDIRKDLLTLFQNFTIRIHALRERKQDIPDLFNLFLTENCQTSDREIPPISFELFQSLIEYEWPGNVSELKTTVKNLVLMSPEGELSIEYLPFEVKHHPFECLNGLNLEDSVTKVEKYKIQVALEKYAGNQTKSAKELEISEAALRYKMKKYNLVRKNY